ncbi:MAG: uracil-DNA glycosylase [Chloroflexi bacterium]|nr:uracil-DNA glycosylase [Chloroflexota bacterium]
MSELTDLYKQITSCRRCADLAKTRTSTVPGDGPEHADIMFIGEAPGFHEDRMGHPFVGAAGQFLDELLASIHLRRENVYICNMIKCRPPQNRDPLPQELEACQPYLDRQIALVNPKIIITLGRFSMAKFFPGASISRIHGQPSRRGDRVYIPMFHPAAALHQPKYRSLITEDFAQLPGILADLAGVQGEEPPMKAEQLSLF